MKNILLATGLSSVNKVINQFNEFRVVGVTDYREKLIESVERSNPDMIVVSEWLSGKENIIEILLNISKSFPNIRIVFLSANLDENDKFAVNRLGTLVMAGIYDISHQTKMTKSLLHHILVTHKEKEDVDYLLKYLKEETKQEILNIEETQEVEDIEENGYPNVITISSIKPGTGKSFISSNIATIIAKYGKKNNGKAPRVALIEADLQNLSIGTILQVEDEKRNLKSVMDKISTLLDSEGNLKADEVQLETANAFIKKCFVPYKPVPNLEVLAGSELTLEDVENITANHYVYLIDVIANEYDIVIIDTNSSLAHVTTYPLLQLAHTCYYILNLDFNNIRNNARYRDELNNMGILNKVKYILNQDIDDNENAKGLIFKKELIDQNEFKLEASIPNMPLPLFLNRLYEGIPIGLDDSLDSSKVRFELSKVANQLWKLDNYDDLKDEVEYYEKKKVENSTKKRRFFDKSQIVRS